VPVPGAVPVVTRASRRAPSHYALSTTGASAFVLLHSKATEGIPVPRRRS
jgi:hypothetical protein